ncbi:leucyl aminopeptidase [Coralloluteibacterium stylophorae]|uniref:Probable cytosol aminopeptidase n=1 Tax=Coralloluteibacterium stylophorae TaxID=1776034 RepID=A0AAP2CE63_9GAMM|nr:leucyl aminopeptidase [Coralloluteibacterium stylophorae]MBS7457792.1 leucyl aminopeptidase [Coralloluteibacterium stylophorae]
MALQFELNRTASADAETDCLIVGVFADAPLAGVAQEIDGEGRLAALVERGDVSGKAGRTSLIPDFPGIRAARLLVVGLGERGKFGASAFQKAVAAAVRALKGSPARSALLTLSALEVNGRDAAWALRNAIAAADHAAYRYTATITRKDDGVRLERLALAGDDEAALVQGVALAAGVEFARELGNLPPNICNPGYIAERARQFATETDGVEAEVLERADMEALGMGSLLSVARGSANPPRLVVLKYSGGGDARPFVLVGKGITFDSGGINLKVQGGIEDMKFDMCGGATVLGTLVAAARMRLPVNLVAIVPAVENMVDADSYRPSDILTSMSGKTIEVGNTDAEGRLILCDALTYAQRFEPQALVDVATLTGACMVALGKVVSGLMTRHDDLADELLAAGETSYDRAWRLPLHAEYEALLESTYADVYNIGGRWGGAITAGCFLGRFTEGQRWAHIDIAGTGSEDGRKGMATGRPVGLLVQWLMDRAG